MLVLCGDKMRHMVNHLISRKGDMGFLAVMIVSVSIEQECCVQSALVNNMFCNESDFVITFELCGDYQNWARISSVRMSGQGYF